MGSAEQSARLRTWPVLELIKARLKDRLRSIEITISPLRPGNVAPAVATQHRNRRTASAQVMPSRRANAMVSIICAKPRVPQKLRLRDYPAALICIASAPWPAWLLQA